MHGAVRGPLWLNGDGAEGQGRGNASAVMVRRITGPI
jgi:hypothetical protein